MQIEQKTICSILLSEYTSFHLVKKIYSGWLHSALFNTQHVKDPLFGGNYPRQDCDQKSIRCKDLPIQICWSNP